MTISAVIIVLVFAGVLCVVFWRRAAAARRSLAIRSYSNEHGFQYVDQQVADIPFNRSSFKDLQSVANAFTGTGARNRFTFFDCHIREGRTGYTQSVLAIEHLEGSYPACRWDRTLREERAGDWTLVYHDRRAWSLSEIDAHVSAL